MGIVFHVLVKPMCKYLRSILEPTSGVVTKEEIFEGNVRGRMHCIQANRTFNAKPNILLGIAMER